MGRAISLGGIPGDDRKGVEPQETACSLSRLGLWLYTAANSKAVPQMAKLQRRLLAGWTAGNPPAHPHRAG